MKRKRKNKVKKFSALKRLKRMAREVFGRVRGTQVIPDKTKYNRKRKHKKRYNLDD